MESVRSIRLLGSEGEARDYLPVLRLLLLLAAFAFGLLVLFYFGLLQTMLRTDRSFISSLILGIFAAATVHCIYQTVGISRELNALRRLEELAKHSDVPIRVAGDRLVASDGTQLEPGITTHHIANLVAKARIQGGRHVDQSLLLRTLADRLRSRERLGWFVAEALLRLALLGTAVGFILMLIPIASLTTIDVETMRQAMTGMSSGMAVALNVTVAGIACALLLKTEYYLLHEAVEELFQRITEFTEVHVVAALERGSDG
jgi:hypothetical protein